MVVPDDLMTEVKLEAVHRHRKLNDLVPELIRIGLATQQAGRASTTAATHQQRAEAWLDNWQKLGTGLQNKAVSAKSCVALLEADRGTRG